MKRITYYTGQHNPLKDQISAFYYEEDTRNWAGLKTY